MGVLFEHRRKILRAGKAKLIGNFGYAQVSLGQAAHGPVYLSNVNIVVDRNVDDALKNRGWMPRRNLAGVRHIGKRDFPLHVLADILNGQRVVNDKDTAKALENLPGKERNYPA